MSILGIVDVIEQQRQEQNISIDDLCRHAGVLRAEYERFITGDVDISLADISRLMDVLTLEIRLKKKGSDDDVHAVSSLQVGGKASGRVFQQPGRGRVRD